MATPLHWLAQMGLPSFDTRTALGWQSVNGQSLRRDDGSFKHRIPGGVLEGLVLQRKWNPDFRSSIQRDMQDGLMPFTDRQGNIFTLPPSDSRTKKMTPMEF